MVLLKRSLIRDKTRSISREAFTSSSPNLRLTAQAVHRGDLPTALRISHKYLSVKSKDLNAQKAERRQLTMGLLFWNFQKGTARCVARRTILKPLNPGHTHASTALHMDMASRDRHGENVEATRTVLDRFPTRICNVRRATKSPSGQMSGSPQ